MNREEDNTTTEEILSPVEQFIKSLPTETTVDTLEDLFKNLTPREAEMLLNNPEQLSREEMIEIIAFCKLLTTGKEAVIYGASDLTPQGIDLISYIGKLPPAKVKALLKDCSYSEDALNKIAYSEEELSILRSSNKKASERNTIKEAKEKRIKEFLLSLSVPDLLIIQERTSNATKQKELKQISLFDMGIEGTEYIPISTTSMVRHIGDYIDIGNLKTLAKKINKRKKKTVANITPEEPKEADIVTLTIKGNRSNEVIRLSSSDFSVKSVKENGEKELDYFLSRVYKEAYNTDTHTLNKNKINISFDDLASDQVCGTSNKLTNRRNWLEFEKFLFYCEFGYRDEYKTKSGTILEREHVGRIITDIDSYGQERRGYHTLTLNNEFPWGKALEHFTLLPNNAFRDLKGRSYRAFKYILEHARISVTSRSDIAVDVIPLSIFPDLLDISRTKNPQRDIKKPIRDIVNEINSKITDINLELIAEENASTEKYLSGEIKVTFSGTYLDNFTEIIKSQAVKIAATKEKKKAPKKKDSSKNKQQNNAN